MGRRNAGSGDDVPGSGDGELDAAWAAIVADLTSGTDDEASGEAPGSHEGDPGDAPGSHDETSASPISQPVTEAPVPSPRPTVIGPRDWAARDATRLVGSWSSGSSQDDDERFVPPDPGPVLGGNPLLTLAWTGAVGAPIALLLILVLWPDAPRVVLQVAGAVFVASFTVLIWRMPARRDDDDDSSGAVV